MELLQENTRLNLRRAHGILRLDHNCGATRPMEAAPGPFGDSSYGTVEGGPRSSADVGGGPGDAVGIRGKDRAVMLGVHGPRPWRRSPSGGTPFRSL